MEKSKIVNIIIISDNVGDTAFNLVKAAAAQYPDAEASYRRYPFITTMEKLERVFGGLNSCECMLIGYTLVNSGLQLATTKFAREHGVKPVDIFSGVVDDIHTVTGLEPSGQIGANHQLAEDYLDRISAMEFAVMYGDGKDPEGFLEVDAVLFDVSRTSKTPLSLFLASRNLEVANLPLVPQTHIPDEIYQIDPKKIIGLTNDPQALNEIRVARLKSYGLDPETSYPNMDAINKELASTQTLFTKLGCYVVDVAHRSIEETAILILCRLGIEDEM